MTYAELVAAISAGTLNIGESIRITDYVTTTAQADTSSAGHQFDLIVTALTNNKLSENAKAVLHDADTYFSGYGARLEAWDIKYTPFNNTAAFAWADTVNGKGVIYFMRDEWGNECHYDFKNILFPRTAGGVVPQTDNYFTFSWVNEDDEIEDLSLIGNSLQNDEGLYSGMFGNKIGVCNASKFPYADGIESLSNNIFISTSAFDSGFFYGCYSNTLGNNCFSNIFGNSCYSNIFGNSCYSNIFGNSCFSNIFGNYCYSNIFGNYCFSNTFGINCYYNIFVDDCFSNIFGNNCYSNSIASSFRYNEVYSNINNTDFTAIAELYLRNYSHQVIGKEDGGCVVIWHDDAGDQQKIVI